MNKKVSKLFKDITDVYFLQCLCTELRDFCVEKDIEILVLNHKCNIYLESLNFLKKDNENKKKEILRLYNIINQLEKFLNENKYFSSGYLGEDLELDSSIKLVLDKLQELKVGLENEIN